MNFTQQDDESILQYFLDYCDMDINGLIHGTNNDKNNTKELLNAFQENEKRMLCVRHKRLARYIENIRKKAKIEENSIAVIDKSMEENGNIAKKEKEDKLPLKTQSLAIINSNNDIKKITQPSTIKDEDKKNNGMEKKELNRNSNPITIIQWVNEHTSLADRELINMKELGGIVFNIYKTKYKKEPNRMYGKTGVRVYKKEEYGIIEEAFQDLLRIKRQQPHTIVVSNKQSTTFLQCQSSDEGDTYLYSDDD